MDRRIQRCMDCGGYTLKEACPNCGGRTANPHPPRFSPEDRYGKYRRKLKAIAMEEGIKD